VGQKSFVRRRILEQGTKLSEAHPAHDEEKKTPRSTVQISNGKEKRMNIRAFMAAATASALSIAGTAQLMASV
jgi:hypothetical protein